MGCFAHEPPALKPTSNHCRLFGGACARCHGLCLEAPSPLSSEEESPIADLDNKHVIILEIRNRATKAKPWPRPRPEDCPFAESLCWVLSPTTGEVLIVPNGGPKGEEYCDCEDGTETFYSVRSCFSRCSSEGRSDCREFRGQSVWEEFRHCEGWPFGLCRRAVMLPPLPSSPSDSWTWRKGSATAAANVCATT